MIIDNSCDESYVGSINDIFENFDDDLAFNFFLHLKYEQDFWTVRLKNLEMSPFQ